MQLEDFDLAPFAIGVLTAQNWYRGKNYSLVEFVESSVCSLLFRQKSVNGRVMCIHFICSLLARP